MCFAEHVFDVLEISQWSPKVVAETKNIISSCFIPDLQGKDIIFSGFGQKFIKAVFLKGI